MAKTGHTPAGRMTAGTRKVSPCDGALRVTIPARIVAQTQLTAGDELRVASTTDGEVAFHPPGVPFVENSDVYAGNASLVQQNGSLRVSILRDAAREIGVTAGDTVKFAFKEGAGVIYLSPEG